MTRLASIALATGLLLLPGCGAATLLAPLIDSAIDDIFNDDQSGDQVPDTTEIGQAVDLEIDFGGRVSCDPKNGIDQRVTVLTLGHVGPTGSDPIRFSFVAESDSKLFALPASGELARGEVATIEVFASDCDFAFQDFRMRIYFVGDEGKAGRSTTTLLTVTNIADPATPALATAQTLAGANPIFDAYVDAVALLEFGGPVKHGDVSVPDKIPGVPLSQISYYGMLRMSFDATALEDLFTGGSALYPVGEGVDQAVFEAETTAPLVAGDYLVGFVSVDGVFDLIDTTRFLRYGLCFDSDGNPSNDYDPPAQTANDPTQGTDRWYFLDFEPGAGWTLRLIDSDNNEQPTGARVIQVGNALVYVIPASEIPGPNAGFRVVTFTHTGDFGLGPDHDWSGDHHPLNDLTDVPE